MGIIKKPLFAWWKYETIKTTSGYKGGGHRRGVNLAIPTIHHALDTPT